MIPGIESAERRSGPLDLKARHKIENAVEWADFASGGGSYEQRTAAVRLLGEDRSGVDAVAWRESGPLDLEDLFVEVDHGPFVVDNNLFLSSVNLLDMSEGGA